MASRHKNVRLRRLGAHGAAAAVSCALVAGTPPAFADAPAAAAPASAVLPAQAADHPPKSGRKSVRYTVRRGDTATELAVRFHAWTAELIAINHLGPRAVMYVGQRLRIPVVLAALPKRKPAQAAPARPRKAKTSTAPKARQPKRTAKTWRHADPSRATVRRAIAATARRVGVDPELALAISWQEAGWQMHHVSRADAIGAMQVIPTTGSWMSLYAGRRLDLYSLRDNVLAGVLLLEVLDDNTRTTRHQVAAYYQGLGAVREHGLYADTKRYVANVFYLHRRLERGWNPAR